MAAPVTFSVRMHGTPPTACILSFDRKMLVYYDEVQATGDELFALHDKEGAVHYVVSFRGVEGVSSAMLGKLITLHRRVERANKKLILCDMEPGVFEMFTSSRLTDYFKVVADQAAALASLPG
jgi:anti-sigma B factor antagonist